MTGQRVSVLADNENFSRVGIWFNDPSNWWGSEGLIARAREHLIYTGIAVFIALLIALPLGLLIGHTGRGVGVVVGLANGLRAVPTLGFVVFLLVEVTPRIHFTQAFGFIPRGGVPYIIPVEFVLIVLAIPPILTNTYAGVQNVDPAARDAAKGMGMRGGQVVRKVELPCAMPLIMSGLRSATLQVIATATVAAYAPFLGGLGRPIVDGVGQINDPQHGYTAMVCAGTTVAVLAVVMDLLLLGVQQLVVSRGISGRFAPLPERAVPGLGADPAAVGSRSTAVAAS